MADPLAYDLPSWSFVDPLDAQAFHLNAACSDEEQQRFLSTMPASPFGLPGWDLAAAEQLESSMAHELGSAEHNPAKSAVCYNYPGRSPSLFTDLKSAKDSIAPDSFQSVDLDDLLRSTSQLATERALYMTVASPGTTPSMPPMYASPPTMDACSSPGGSHHSSSSVSEADWERDMGSGAPHMPPVAPFYSLPDAFAFQPSSFYPPQPQQQQQQQQQQQAAGKEGLTPLEMPDGSTRFTANWLPVDPEGGFTIHAMPSTHRAPCDLEYPDYSQDAFISVDHGRLSAAGV
ncbi:hypothetical protein BDV59DRAFT_204798 [Aspergillus ambiguus]|uniref:uncharacterized protein n=1 Tax=Aspergillus ambiguus TaxID=176160 RepID=UPI003CCDC0CB